MQPSATFGVVAPLASMDTPSNRRLTWTRNPPQHPPQPITGTGDTYERFIRDAHTCDYCSVDLHGKLFSVGARPAFSRQSEHVRGDASDRRHRDRPSEADASRRWNHGF